MRMRLGRSLGSPTNGHLLGGSHLGDAPYLRIVPFYAQGDVRWGLELLVSMVDRAARTVRIMVCHGLRIRPVLSTRGYSASSAGHAARSR